MITMLLAIAALPAQGAAPPARADWVETGMTSVTRYWEYTAAFRDSGLDFLGTRYRPSTNAAVYFRNEAGSLFGFCVDAFKICHGYNMLPDGVVTHSTWLRMNNGEKAAAALHRFSKRGFADQDDVDREGGSEHPSPESVIIKNGPLVLKGIGAPEAVRLKKPLSAIERYLQWGDKALFETSEPNCTVVVPFADLSYPEIPVLFECPNGRSVQVLTRSWDATAGAPYWYPTAGGYLRDPESVGKMAPIIRRNGTIYRAARR